MTLLIRPKLSYLETRHTGHSLWPTSTAYWATLNFLLFLILAVFFPWSEKKIPAEKNNSRRNVTPLAKLHKQTSEAESYLKLFFCSGRKEISVIASLSLSLSGTQDMMFQVSLSVHRLHELLGTRVSQIQYGRTCLTRLSFCLWCSPMENKPDSLIVGHT